MPDLSPARRLAARILREGKADLTLEEVREVAGDLGAATFGDVAHRIDVRLLPATHCLYLGSYCERGQHFFRYGSDKKDKCFSGPAMAGED